MTRSPEGSVRVAYLVSRYPAVSHTFIRREVAALRDRGLEVRTFSVRRPADSEVLSPDDRAERDRTLYLLPTSAWRLAFAHLRMLARRPRAYAGTLALAQRHRPAGARAALWALFHFVEAVLLADALDRGGVTHLHVHFGNAGGTVGFLATRLVRVGFSQTLHGHADFHGPFEPQLGDKIAASRFTACVSQFGRSQALLRSDPEAWDRVRVVRCGVALGRFPRRAAEPPGPPWVVASVGRLAPEKGHMVLLRAVARLAARDVDVRLVLVGEGPERGRIERETARLGLEGRVEMRGALPEPQVRAVLEQAHAFALGSFVEGLPVVLMEAMAIGVPVVAPRITGIPELVEHGRTGFLYACGADDELASALERVLVDRATAASLAEEGRRKVVRDFDVRLTVAPLLDAFGLRDDAASLRPEARTRRAGPRAGSDVPGGGGRSRADGPTPAPPAASTPAPGASGLRGS